MNDKIKELLETIKDESLKDWIIETEEEERRKQEEWNNKTNEEKLAYYKENNIFLAKYVDMSKEELEKELEFHKNIVKTNYRDVYHGPLGSMEEIDRIRTIMKLKD